MFLDKRGCRDGTLCVSGRSSDSRHGKLSQIDRNRLRGIVSRLLSSWAATCRGGTGVFWRCRSIAREEEAKGDQQARITFILLPLARVIYFYGVSHPLGMRARAPVVVLQNSRSNGEARNEFG